MNEIQLFFELLFCKAREGFISLRGFKKNGGTAFKAESYIMNDPKLFSAAFRLSTEALSTPGVVVFTPTATFNNSQKARSEDVINGVAFVSRFR